MHAVVVFLLAGPAATVVVFTALALIAVTTYALSAATHETGPLWEALPGSSLSHLPWWKLQRCLWRQARTRRGLAIRLARVAVPSLAVVPGVLASYVILLPLYTLQIVSGQPVPHVTPVPKVVGGALAVLSVAKCLRYLAGRAPTHGLLHGPELRLTDHSLALRDRIAFNRRVYLYTHLRWASRMAALCGPALVVGAASAIPATAAPPASTPTVEVIGGALVVAVVSLSVVVGNRLDVAVIIAMPSVHAAVLVHKCLPEFPRLVGERVGWARDPLAGRRKYLRAAALALTRAGMRLDGVAPEHPVASVIFGCSAYIRTFLSNVAALSACYPRALDDMLTNVVAVLAGPDPQRAIALGSRVGAFDRDGQPVADLRNPRKRPWVLLLERAGDSLERYSRITTAAWALVTLGLVIFLIVTGRLDPTNFQLQK